MPASLVTQAPAHPAPAAAAPLTTSVVVPSYRRAESLPACLAALAAQSAPAGEIIVVAREGDRETLAVCARMQARIATLRTVLVAVPGAVAALNAGLRSAQGKVVAITDDDAQPEPEWLERIAAIFAADPRVGAVGGPDLIAGSTRRAVGRGRVGRISWYGRFSGNHDVGAVREDVDVLKGVNLSLRAGVLPGFDARLRGRGAQVGWDMQAALRVKRRGYRVVYDPRVRVRHHPAPRPDGVPRNWRSLKLLREHHFNESYIVVSSLSARRAAVCTAYAMLVGYRSAPGLAHLGLRLMIGPRRLRAIAEWAAVAVGRLEGIACAAAAWAHRAGAGEAGAWTRS